MKQKQIINYQRRKTREIYNIFEKKYTMSKEKLYYLAQIYYETFISNLKKNFENLVKRLRLSWISLATIIRLIEGSWGLFGKQICDCTDSSEGMVRSPEEGTGKARLLYKFFLRAKAFCGLGFIEGIPLRKSQKIEREFPLRIYR